MKLFNIIVILVSFSSCSYYYVNIAEKKSRCTDCFVNKANENRWQNYAYIGYEFAHAVHWAIAGNDFNTYSHDIKEHFAVLAQMNLIESQYLDGIVVVGSCRHQITQMYI